jgi:GT2 family glycosyltransferase
VTADVVVVTWRARELLARCLDHLAAQDVDHRVIVVDNASGDGSAELARERGATVLALEDNVGFGRACNLGAAAGDGEAVVLVNNDVFCEPGFLRALLEPLADPRVGMVAGHTLRPDGGTDALGVELGAGLDAYNRGAFGAPGVLAGPSGGAAAYRRTAWEAAGGFDERLFAYHEDLDLLLRLRRAGWQAAEAPEARGVHLGGASAGLDSPFQRRLGAFGRGFVLRRYGVLRRAPLRVLAIDGAVCLFGLVRHRTLDQLTGRVRGWRAASSTPTLALPPGIVDERLTLATALRRLRR